MLKLLFKFMAEKQQNNSYDISQNQNNTFKPKNLS